MRLKRHLGHVPLWLLVAIVVSWARAPVGVDAHQAGWDIRPELLERAGARIATVDRNLLVPPDFARYLAEEARHGTWELPEDVRWPGVDEGYPWVPTRRQDVVVHRLDATTGLTQVMDMYRLSAELVRMYNPDLDFARARAGDEVRVWVRPPGIFSRSVGRSNGGRLYAGEPLPQGDGYRVINPHRAFGTYYTISELVRVLDTHAFMFPDAPPLLVGDISQRQGRYLEPHVSHQSGRDVDLGIPSLPAAGPRAYFSQLTRSEIDVPRTLWLLKALLDGGHVEYVFLESYVQRLLLQEARRQGAPESWLRRVFEYGAPMSEARQASVIVRHVDGHSRHMHVRFRCQPTDENCK